MGATEEIVSKYLEPTVSDITGYHPTVPLSGIGIDLIDAELLFDGKSPNNGQEINFKVNIKLLKSMQFSAHMFVHRENDLAMVASDFHNPVANQKLDIGQYTLQFTIPPYLLNPGYHKLGILFSDYNGNSQKYLFANEIIKFDLEDDGYRRNGRYHRGWDGSVSPVLSVFLRKYSNEKTHQ
jgi:lipopolysaccharide transport system ATP-binding protein